MKKRQPILLMKPLSPSLTCGINEEHITITNMKEKLLITGHIRI